MSTNENLNHQEHQHMRKEELLEYLLSKMTEENGVYKTVLNRKDIENNPQLYHLYFRKDLQDMELKILDGDKTIQVKLIQETIQDDTAGKECITVIFSPEIGKRVMRRTNAKKDNRYILVIRKWNMLKNVCKRALKRKSKRTFVKISEKTNEPI